MKCYPRHRKSDALRYRRANRQYAPIPEADIWRFVASKEKLYVAFSMESGYPHVTPMWFCILDGKLYLRTHDYKVKAKLAGSGKACCTLDEGSRYVELRGVVIWGQTRVVKGGELVERIEKAMRTKYRDKQWRASEMPEWWVRERRAEKRAYVEIVPVRISSWDNHRVCTSPALAGRVAAPIRPVASSNLRPM
ncbi:MAG: pyridoxamine 5'-phosphate oxidase family protein [Nitrososphaerota archaeon]|nr:pyridoxamine 5'-phosphate oxidase family protein [Nitrososphaerota archaeon]MDG6943101.1 pyridoxamine 5'-phosphate oxidase family protein [Nitrososphaerota archaeon]